LTSSALESKSEGLIYGIGSNMFKLAGSVITYGIVSAYILGILRYVVLVIGGAL
jgi:stage V sporulation protein AC